MMAIRARIVLLLCSALLANTLQGVQGEAEVDGPSESECRPYIEKALKKLETGDTQSAEVQEDDISHIVTTDDSDNENGDEIEIIETKSVEDGTQEANDNTEEDKSVENEVETEKDEEQTDEIEDTQEDSVENTSDEKQTETEENAESAEKDISIETEQSSAAKDEDNTKENIDSKEQSAEEQEQTDSEHETSVEQEITSQEDDGNTVENEQEETISIEQDGVANVEQDDVTSVEEQDEKVSVEQDDATSVEQENSEANTEEAGSVEQDEKGDSVEQEQSAEKEKSVEQDNTASVEEEGTAGSVEEAETAGSVEGDEASVEQTSTEKDETSIEQENEASVENEENRSKKEESGEDNAGSVEAQTDSDDVKEKEESAQKDETTEDVSVETDKIDSKQESTEQADEEVIIKEENEESEENETEPTPEEDLTWEVEIPTDLRARNHINEIFNLNDEISETDNLILKAADKTLNELKRIYENAIKPLEILYKYRDLSNRHFGDPEIFSKPLVVFMGPWSGGKSSIINYLIDNEYSQTSLRTGAEPSPAYFNLIMWGEEPEILGGTQLAADWTFSGLQKFGQGLEERLRGLKLPNKLLEKINIVEIPGILEVRKQVSRMFPFNDACQWFIDRADIIFLVYDPSKLDVGPETEAILDQLKGREYQTRIILNKADQVKPEELMRVQGALIWNISPLMSSAQPPIMYSTSLWSRPYETGAPVRLLQAQEVAFLKDIKTAIDKRIENKIASARRFAVRVRNHAKMVDCYLTTYYNHKSVFGNKKLVADQIIEHPQDYHIYEGLSTLTNISRYDLPDPDVYRDFFRLNPLYDFQQLSATCTYFRGCPINRLDIAIAYDLPELVGKYKKMIEPAQNSNSVDSSTKS